MNSHKYLLEIKNLTFYSLFDEKAFLNWLSKFSSFLSFEKKEFGFCFFFYSLQITDDLLRSLIAFFSRYNLEMSLLSTFLTDKNKHWFFGNKEAFRNSKIFGKKPRKKEFTQRVVQANWRRWYKGLGDH